ncbi:ethanolamine ammonia-lyase subunit EutC [Halobacillus sp. BBL2006]|uniref:ethanolamine ammonia-lyase subunit EutC n=1 Tax=Halobacillus sp. BBL2006 TaxID=1543706 RepID=UPI000543CA2F|nr:ethanolamine ammonia-lyase subunit EutC [Halobacillus sp. BBL2006]KHE70753.1 ethanolamine ammonia-lyase [Halobacillus sp. BBL2006]
MDKDMIETVTRLVMEKMNDKKNVHKPTSSGVKIWDHTSSDNHYKTIESSSIAEDNVGGKAVLSKFPKQQKSKPSPVGTKVKSSEQKDEGDHEDLRELKSKTPARIGVGRAGVRPRTDTWLRFRYDHAAAVDAVYGNVDRSLLEDLDLFVVNTKVTDQETYIRRPDYGRKLSDEAKAKIHQSCKKNPQVQIIVSDGLSSKAIDENLEDVYLSLQQSLKSLGLDVGTSFFIEKGRVAAMDDVGEELKPEVIVYLIGERPGLVSAESMSAYLCYKPRKGTIESQRQVVSNIHSGGIPPVEAGAYLGGVVEKILDYEASGVELVKKEG